MSQVNQNNSQSGKIKTEGLRCDLCGYIGHFPFEMQGHFMEAHRGEGTYKLVKDTDVDSFPKITFTTNPFEPKS